MNYSTNIPALPPLPAAAHIRTAPGVVANTPLSEDDILAAEEETGVRKKLRIRDPTTISANQLAASISRKQAIINEHAAVVYAGAGAPGWFAPALTAALAPINVTLQSLQAHAANQRIFNRNLLVGMRTELYFLQYLSFPFVGHE